MFEPEVVMVALVSQGQTEQKSDEVNTLVYVLSTAYFKELSEATAKQIGQELFKAKEAN